MIKTYGLTHIALAVKNARHAFGFYRQVLGVEKVCDKGSFIQAQTPGTRAAKLVTKAGGKILDKGEFCPGEPYLYCSDLDGYVVEIWYELPTPVDPKRNRRPLAADRLS